MSTVCPAGILSLRAHSIWEEYALASNLFVYFQCNWIPLEIASKLVSYEVITPLYILHNQNEY